MESVRHSALTMWKEFITWDVARAHTLELCSVIWILYSPLPAVWAWGQWQHRGLGAAVSIPWIWKVLSAMLSEHAHLALAVINIPGK